MNKIASLFFLILLIVSCNSDDYKRFDAPDSSKKDLVERQIGKTDYYISIPEADTLNYKMNEDFDICYIYPKDSTDTLSPTLGLYFGDHPDRETTKSDSCSNERIRCRIMGFDKVWDLKKCNKHFSINTLLETDEKWPKYIHLFASGKADSGIEKALVIFSTLSLKTKKL